MSIKVLSPGLYTTVQDIGRTGFQKYGVVVSGAMDTISYRLANLLVGNFSNEAALEITLIGPSLLFNKNAVISICGANMIPKINGKPAPIAKAIEVNKGDIVSFGSPISGCRLIWLFQVVFRSSLCWGARAHLFKVHLEAIEEEN